MVEIKNSHQIIEIIQDQGPVSFQFPMKTVINFCAIWAFVGYKWTHGQRSVVAAEVSTTFSNYPLLRASCCNFSGSSLQTHAISSLVSLFPRFDPFFYFTLIFRCHNQRMERINGFPDPELYAESFEKKIH